MGHIRPLQRLGRYSRLLPVGALLLTLLFNAFLAEGAAAAGTESFTYTANERWCPREVAPYCSENAFYDFWRSQPDALETLGYPIDHPRRTTDGLIIQFYERAIMEWHPENGVEYQVLLSRLGAFSIEGNARTREAPTLPCTRSENCVLAEATNHTLRGTFLNHWVNFGGLQVYGFPLTEEYQERNVADGRFYTVQYFERNRFEYHPENRGRYQVLLGRLGAETLEANRAAVNRWQIVTTPNYGNAPTTPPPATTAMAVAPTAGPPGTVFVVTGSGLTPGATVVSTITYENGAEVGRESFELGRGQDELTVRISTDAATRRGTYTVTWRIGANVFGTVTFRVT